MTGTRVPEVYSSVACTAMAPVLHNEVESQRDAWLTHGNRAADSHSEDGQYRSRSHDGSRRHRRRHRSPSPINRWDLYEDGYDSGRVTPLDTRNSTEVRSCEKPASGSKNWDTMVCTNLSFVLQARSPETRHRSSRSERQGTQQAVVWRTNERYSQ